MNDKTKNLLIRTASGAVLFAVVLLATLTNIHFYALFALGLTIGSLWEFYGMCRKAGYTPNRVFGLAIAVLVVLIGLLASHSLPYLPSSTLPYTILIAAAVVFLSVMVFVSQLWRGDPKPIANISTTFAGVTYIAVPVVAMTLLGLMNESEWNGANILAYMIIVWANDVFAYLFGMTFGRHKMCPSISPKKSWEGCVGGVVSACLVSAAIGALWLNIPPVLMGFWGVVIALSGVAGDLVESMFKRSLGLKDSGNIMPGHGGFLDRFDALFLSAPMALVTVIIWNFIMNLQ
ncbi:MAG: phosphatidate cytidylyltransferase [Rikenellaceae bacterium]|nr:phosphatidate cytidylyltransferase [Rikenellaceae bacterium]